MAVSAVACPREPLMQTSHFNTFAARLSLRWTSAVGFDNWSIGRKASARFGGSRRPRGLTS